MITCSCYKASITWPSPYRLRLAVYFISVHHKVWWGSRAAVQSGATYMETFALLYTHLKSKEVRISPVYLKSGLVGPACFKHIDLRQDEFESYVRTPCTFQTNHTPDLLYSLAYKTSMPYAYIEYAYFMYQFTFGMPHSSIVILPLHTCNHKGHCRCGVCVCVRIWWYFLLLRAQSTSPWVSWLASRSLMSLASTHER